MGVSMGICYHTHLRVGCKGTENGIILLHFEAQEIAQKPNRKPTKVPHPASDIQTCMLQFSMPRWWYVLFGTADVCVISCLIDDPSFVMVCNSIRPSMLVSAKLHQENYLFAGFLFSANPFKVSLCPQWSSSQTSLICFSSLLPVFFLGFYPFVSPPFPPWFHWLSPSLSCLLN